MSISKTTDLGKITISNLVFAELIKESLDQEECKGRVFPASIKGRLLGNEEKFNLLELSHEISVEQDENNRIEITFCVIIRFGSSISMITDTLADYIANEIEKKQGEKPSKIIINVVGVKSKQIRRRDLEIIKEYGA